MNVRILDRRRKLAKQTAREVVTDPVSGVTVSIPDMVDLFADTEFSLVIDSILSDLEKTPKLAKLFKDVVDLIQT
ncbi:unnamed protein product, partial [marine sediment metagenome]